MRTLSSPPLAPEWVPQSWQHYRNGRGLSSPPQPARPVPPVAPVLVEPRPSARENPNFGGSGFGQPQPQPQPVRPAPQPVPEQAAPFQGVEAVRHCNGAGAMPQQARPVPRTAPISAEPHPRPAPPVQPRAPVLVEPHSASRAPSNGLTGRVTVVMLVIIVLAGLVWRFPEEVRKTIRHSKSWGQSMLGVSSKSKSVQQKSSAMRVTEKPRDKTPQRRSVVAPKPKMEVRWVTTSLKTQSGKTLKPGTGMLIDGYANDYFSIRVIGNGKSYKDRIHRDMLKVRTRADTSWKELKHH